MLSIVTVVVEVELAGGGMMTDVVDVLIDALVVDQSDVEAGLPREDEVSVEALTLVEVVPSGVV